MRMPRFWRAVSLCPSAWATEASRRSPSPRPERSGGQIGSRGAGPVECGEFLNGLVDGLVQGLVENKVRHLGGRAVDVDGGLGVEAGGAGTERHHVDGPGGVAVAVEAAHA